MNTTPFCSTEIEFLDKESFVKKIISLDLMDVVLILSKNGAERWGLCNFVLKLKSDLNSFVWIDYVPSNPTSKDIERTLIKIGNNNVKTIIAIGGGSAIDLAKCVSIFYNPIKILSEEELRESIKSKSYINSNAVDIIAVPTTAGTGSEVTQWATLWDIENKEKFSVDCIQIKPKIALIIPEFTLSLSNELTLSTGLDALSHAIEAYWSKHTTPLVQDIAYRAIQIIVSDLRNVIDNPSDICIREKMCRASLLAGIAFSQTRTTACHAISYPLTMYYEVPHGFAVALTLANVAKLNKGYFSNDTELYSLFNGWGGLQGWLDYVCNGVVDLSLKSFGVNNIELIAEKSFTKGRMDNNPVTINKQDIINIILNQ